MFFTWKEVSDFFYVTPFELFLFLIALSTSSVLLTIKLVTESSYRLLSWYTVASPHFLFDLLSTYFCIIVFIRQFQTGAFHKAFVRLFFSLKRNFLLFMMKMLICFKLDGALDVKYAEILVSLFYLLFIAACRAIRK